ncbi:MAG: hypothetical protein OEV08_05090 [Nitrospira sp.]|nr:hypothetical protein [Nitrospira sp.]
MQRYILIRPAEPVEPIRHPLVVQLPAGTEIVTAADAQASLDEVLKEAVKFAVACLESRELRDSAHWFLNYDKRVNEYRTRQGKKEG